MSGDLGQEGVWTAYWLAVQMEIPFHDHLINTCIEQKFLQKRDLEF